MKNKLLALVLTLAPAALCAGTVPSANASSLKGCVRFTGREVERGFSAAAHLTKETGHATREGVKTAVKDTDHAVVRAGEWIAGS